MKDTIAGIIGVAIFLAIGFGYANKQVKSMEKEYFPETDPQSKIERYKGANTAFRKQIEYTNYYILKDVPSLEALLLSILGNEYTKFMIDTGHKGAKVVKKMEKKNARIRKEIRQDILMLDAMKLQGVGKLDLMMKVNEIVDKYKTTCDVIYPLKKTTPRLAERFEYIEECNNGANELFDKLRYKAMMSYSY